MKEKRINEHYRLLKESDYNVIKVQMRFLGAWINIWQRRYLHGEEEYAVQCANELIEHLEAKI